jgi:group I intron endonuclease
MDLSRPHIYRRQLVATGMYYIGKHNGNKKHYIGSGVDWVKALKEHVLNKQTDIIVEILEYVDDVNLLNEREEYWLKLYNVDTNPLYYNRTSRSRGWTLVTKEQREKLRISHTGKKQSPESTQKKRDKMLGIPKHTNESKLSIGDKNRHPKPEGFRKNGDYKFTDEHKNALSLSKSKKPIYMMDINMNVIDEFRGTTHACRSLNLDPAKLKSMLINGGIYKGYYWKYKIIK